MPSSIRLKYATTQSFAVGGVPGGVTYTYVRAKVRNLAFEKHVAVHFRGLSAEAWLNMDLNWVAHYGTHDIFGRDGGFATNEFVVFATQGGVTAFDNNSGANYHVGSNQSLVGGNVALHRAVARQGIQGGGGFIFQTSWFEGEIYVQNLNFAKRIGVRHTVDGWATVADAEASYVGPVAEGVYAGGVGAELWQFRTPELNLNPVSPVFEFAVFYQRLDTGEMFWDNNFGLNYRLSKMSGATVE